MAFLVYLGPDEGFKGRKKRKGCWGKKAFETTAFGGEIISGPVKEFVQFFSLMIEVIFS